MQIDDTKNVQRCSACKNTLTLDFFSKNKSRPNGYHHVCKKCSSNRIAEYKLKGTITNRKEYSAEYYKNNRDRIKIRDAIKFASAEGKTIQTLYRKTYRKSDKGKTAFFYSKIKHKYGLARIDYDALIAAQNNKCAICKNEFTLRRMTHVDHCHATNHIRGILCYHCNVALGFAKNDIGVLISMILYLERQPNNVKEKK